MPMLARAVGMLSFLADGRRMIPSSTPTAGRSAGPPHRVMYRAVPKGTCAPNPDDRRW